MQLVGLVRGEATREDAAIGILDEPLHPAGLGHALLQDPAGKRPAASGGIRGGAIRGGGGCESVSPVRPFIQTPGRVCSLLTPAQTSVTPRGDPSGSSFDDPP